MEFDASNRLCFMCMQCAQLSGDPLRLTNWIIYLFKVQVTFDAVSGDVDESKRNILIHGGSSIESDKLRNNL